jgi:hypothetical protein
MAWYDADPVFGTGAVSIFAGIEGVMACSHGQRLRNVADIVRLIEAAEAMYEAA